MKNKLSKALSLIFIVCSLAFIFTAIPNIKNNNEPVYASTQATTSSPYYNSTEEIFTQIVNQNPYGLCWDFSACGIVESAIAKKFNVDLDISEAWLSVSLHINQNQIAKELNYLPFDYIVGSGSNVEVAIYLMKNYGFLLEDDFPYFGFNGINTGNVQNIYDTYKDKVYYLKDMGIDFSYTRGTIAIKNSDCVEQIKELCLTNGAVALSVYSSNDVYLKQTDGTWLHNPNETKESNHAVRIVGWDNNYHNKGAFIIENSYGDDTRTFYMYYSDFSSTSSKKSIRVYNAKVDALNCYISSNSTAYKKNNPSSSEYFINNQNVFYNNQNINISYTCSDFKSTTPKIYFQEKNVSSLFISSYNNSTNTFTITTSKPLSTGYYSVQFETNNSKYPKFQTFISVITGSEFNLAGGQIKYGANNIKTLYGYLNNGVSFYVNELNMLCEQPTVIADDCLNITINDASLTYATATSYAKGYVRFNIALKQNKSLIPGCSFTITFTTLLGSTNVYKVIVIANYGETVYSFYDIGSEATLTGALPTLIYLDKTNKKGFLPTAKSLTKFIAKWQVLNKDGSTTLLPYDSNAKMYYFTPSHYTVATGASYDTNLDTSKYIILQPIWEDFGYEITFDMPAGGTINDNNHPRTISKTATDKSYTFKVEASEGFILSNIKVSYITGSFLTPTNAATNEYKIPSITKDTLITITYTATVIAPSKIEFTTNNISKTYDGQNSVITAQITYDLDTNFTAVFIWYKNSIKQEEQEVKRDKSSTLNVKDVLSNGNYSCEVYIVLDGLNSDKITTKTISVNISKANVSIELIPSTITYGDELDPTKTKDKYKVVSGAVFNDDDLMIDLLTPYTKTTNAGTDCSITAIGANNHNYNVTFNNGKNTSTITVTKRKIKVKADDFVVKKGDKINPILNTKFKVIGGSLVNNDKLSVIINCDVKQDSPAGKYTITIKLNESAANYSSIKNNYDIEFVNGTYTIKHKTFYYVILGMRIWCFIEFGIILIIILKKSKKSEKKFNKSENLGYNYNGRK